MGNSYFTSMPWGFTPTYGWGNTTSSTNNESKKLTYEEKLAQYKEKAELRKAQREYELELKTANENMQQIEAAKQEDGSAVIKTEMKDYKKLSWWKKTLRACGNMAQGVWKIATNFVGYENGKWNWKKCLKNVSIAAAVIGLTCIPYVGPVISAGLLASGVIAGTVGTGVGIYKACKAESVEELDKGFQDIGSGAFIGITSAFGLKGLSKAGGGGVSGICNSVKQGMSAGKQSIQNQGFFKAWGQNIKAQLPASPKNRFENSKNKLLDDLNRQAAELDAQINESTGSTQALLKNDKSAIEKQIAELNRCNTKKQWDNLRTNSCSHKRVQTLQEKLSKLELDGSVNLNRTTLTADNISQVESMVQRAEALTKQLESISRLRLATMRLMALRPKKYGAELDAFAGHSRTRLGYQWDMRGQVTLKGAAKLPFKVVGTYWNLPFKPWNYVSKTPAGSYYKIEQAILPVYEENMLDGILGMFGNAQALGGAQHVSAEEVSQTLAQLTEAKTALESELSSIKSSIASMA